MAEEPHSIPEDFVYVKSTLWGFQPMPIERTGGEEDCTNCTPCLPSCRRGQLGKKDECEDGEEDEDEEEDDEEYEDEDEAEGEAEGEGEAEAESEDEEEDEAAYGFAAMVSAAKSRLAASSMNAGSKGSSEGYQGADEGKGWFQGAGWPGWFHGKGLAQSSGADAEFSGQLTKVSASMTETVLKTATLLAEELPQLVQVGRPPGLLLEQESLNVDSVVDIDEGIVCSENGSSSHWLLQCKPCAYAWKEEGCQNGDRCKFCHLCPPGEKQRRKRYQRQLARPTRHSASQMMACSRNRTEDEIADVWEEDGPVPASVGDLPPTTWNDSAPDFNFNFAQPLIGDSTHILPSMGSYSHALLQCKPCSFYWKPEGCRSGANCEFCHLCPAGEKQRRKGISRRTAALGSAYAFRGPRPFL